MALVYGMRKSLNLFRIGSDADFRLVRKEFMSETLPEK